MERKDICLGNCGFVKALLMLMVIFGHSIAFWTQKWLDIEVIIPCTILGYGYSWVNSFHIYFIKFMHCRKLLLLIGQHEQDQDIIVLQSC